MGEYGKFAKKQLTSFQIVVFFDQKTYTIGVMAHQILPKFRVSLKVSKLMFLTAQKPEKD